MAFACASAMPADGAAIAGIGHRVDPTINVATKKEEDQQLPPSHVRRASQLSNRTGNCRVPTG